MRIGVLLSQFFGKERRKVDEPVKTERRGRGGLKESTDRVTRALDDLEQTVRMRQEDLDRHEFRGARNDRQQVVLFHTFQEICRFRGPDAIKVRFCRHPRHEDASNTQFAICEESHCPVMNEALGGTTGMAPGQELKVAG